MAEEKEASFPIEEFKGINRNLDREDMGAYNFWSAKNLWEKRIGLLETRGGSDDFADIPALAGTIAVQTVGFSSTPDAGSFSLIFNEIESVSFAYTANFATLQNGLRNIRGLESITVSGSFAAGFTITFTGYDGAVALLTEGSNTLTASAVAVTTSIASSVTGVAKTKQLTKVMSVTKIYKDDNTTARVAAVGVSSPTILYDTIGNLPAGIGVAFSNESGAYFNVGSVFGGLTWGGEHLAIYVRLVGYGYEAWYGGAPSSISGYSSGVAQKLTVTISADLGPRITGYELYVAVNCGTTGTPRQVILWNGFKSLVGVSSDTHEYWYTPLGQGGAIALNTQVGETKASFTASGSSSGGSLISGKTYYVSVIPHHIKIQTSTDRRCAWSAASMSRNGDADIIPVTIPGTPGEPYGSISISSISTAKVSFVTCIGETPELLIPVDVWNDSAGLGTVEITDYPSGSPAVFNIIPTSSGVGTYVFKSSRYSLYDMFIRVDDDGTVNPIYFSRLDADGNVNDEIDKATLYITAAISNVADNFPVPGVQNRYDFEQVGNLAFFVNGYNVRDPRSQSLGYTFDHRTGSNYSMTDGYIAAPVIEEYQATQLTLPIFDYISKFEGSVMLAGGPRVVDENTGLAQSAGDDVYFSRALDPYDFTIPGAASTTHQTIRATNTLIHDSSEKISGIGIYSGTSSDSGPYTRFLITKKNSLSVLNAVPEASGTPATLGQASLSVISSKSGCVNGHTIVNTPIGTILAAADNVYLLRDVGEPTPVGQNLRHLLRGADMTYAHAVYHDGHYKLSFYHSDYSGSSSSNNVELWLNITKMIEQKGAPDWVGPMTGRSVQYSFVEDKALDGLQDDIARDRIVCDGSAVRLYKADVEQGLDDCFDFNTRVTGELETKDYPISQQDDNWNKLLKRTYWKLKTQRVSTDPLDYTETTYVDGVTFEALAATAYGLSATDFDDQPLTLSRVFPTGRPRGRIFRKKFSTQHRVGIAGFALNYEIERRRI